MADSTKIAAYLDQQYPHLPSLTGPAPALNSFVITYIGTTIQPLIAKLCFDHARAFLDPEGEAWYYSQKRGDMFGYKGGMPKLQAPEADKEKLIKELRRALEPVRSVVKGNKFLGGDVPICGLTREERGSSEERELKRAQE
jgi:glutathione S-transferase